MNKQRRLRLVSGMLLSIGLMLTACGQEGKPVNADTSSNNGNQPAANVPQSNGPDTAVSGQPGQGGGVQVGSKLQGRVTDAAGQPVAGVIVMPQSIENPPRPVPEIAIYTDEQGRYQWPLEPGRYTLTFIGEGFAQKTQPVVVAANAAVAPDVALQRQ